LANQEKKLGEAVGEATRAREIARDAFGPASAEVDEALLVLRQLHAMSGETVAEIVVLREQAKLRRERFVPGHWRIKEVEALLALRERIAALPADRRAAVQAIARQINQVSDLRQRGQFDEA